MDAIIYKINKTKQGRFSLFTEDGFLFSVDGETLIKNNITEGSVLSSVDLARLKSDSDTRKAKDKALQYLSLRDHSSKELYDKLRLKFDDMTAAEAVSEMLRLELVNDAAFAEHRAKYLAKQGKPTREIERVLREKGIERADIASAIQNADISDANACIAVVNKLYRTKLLNGEKDKVYAALARRGFGYKDIKCAIAQFIADIDCEDDGEDI